MTDKAYSYLNELDYVNTMDSKFTYANETFSLLLWSGPDLGHENMAYPKFVYPVNFTMEFPEPDGSTVPSFAGLHIQTSNVRLGVTYFQFNFSSPAAPYRTGLMAWLSTFHEDLPWVSFNSLLVLPLFGSKEAPAYLHFCIDGNHKIEFYEVCCYR